MRVKKLSKTFRRKKPGKECNMALITTIVVFSILFLDYLDSPDEEMEAEVEQYLNHLDLLNHKLPR